jgi:O-acetyl-ADP-ribose deacetylase (regulator of RNase III)
MFAPVGGGLTASRYRFRMETHRSGLTVLRGDITRLRVDAIVNAANELMLGGGGVDGAIHAAAGRRLLDACRAVPEVRPGVRCPTGEARVTPGFDLAATFVVHTVGPVWRGGQFGEDDLLAACYRASFHAAESHSVQAIAFPAISCGVYRFPVRRASSIAVREIREHLTRARSISTVFLVAFDAAMFEVLNEAAAEPPA